jgi:hypothetical protein
MGADEKTRTSGESPREQTSMAILPTVNPNAEKPLPPKPSMHAAVYVM